MHVIDQHENSLTIFPCGMPSVSLNLTVGLKAEEIMVWDLKATWLMFVENRN